MAKVIIFGVGEIAQVASVYLDHDSPHEVVAFTVDGEFIRGKEVSGRPVVPFEEVGDRYPPESYSMFVPVSYRKVNRLREQKYREAKEKGYSLISYISSKCVTWPGLKVGDNCFIFELNVIQPFVEIGDNVILWSGNHIGHHTRIGNHVFLASHVVISGSVTVEPYSFFGVNATIRDGITIAESTVVGAGALVLKDTHPGDVILGTPGKLLPKKSGELKAI